MAEVRERGAVAETRKAVDDGGRVDDDVDLLVRHAEEEVRLDQLEPFVRERGGVHGDLTAHPPGRMPERLLRRHVGELLPRAAAERPAGRGQDERVELLRAAPLEALEERRVLAVHRQEEPSPALACRQRELAGGDEALLVRERERDAAFERPQRRRKAREAHDGVQHDVGLGALEELRQVPADLRQRREAVDRLRPRRRRDELEPGVRLDDLERLPADRTGCSEERDARHPCSATIV